MPGQKKSQEVHHKRQTKTKIDRTGGESLADALLELAIQSDTADDMVDRLITTPQENTVRFKEKLSSLKQSEFLLQFIPLNVSPRPFLACEY